MTMTKAKNTSILMHTLPARRKRSLFALASTAFCMMLLRDLLVISRDLISFLLQVLLQPLFLLLIFGKILPTMGLTASGFGAVFLPGVIGFTVMMTSLQGITLPLTMDLGFGREIDDRLLAPMPVQLIAVEKMVFSSLRGLLAGLIIFPLAFWILGSGYQVRTDEMGILIGIITLTAFVGASLGLTIGTVLPVELISLAFSLIFPPLIFLGCAYYPWNALGSIRWLQMITLLNPLTYASEGLRYAMVPPINGHTLPTLGIGWVWVGLGTALVLFSILGICMFSRRVVN